MFIDILITFLISFSPFGEARAGIPYGELTGLPIMLAFVIGLLGNLLVFPLLYKGIELSNKHLLKNSLYKKSAIYLSVRARTKTQKVIKKYEADNSNTELSRYCVFEEKMELKTGKT